MPTDSDIAERAQRQAERQALKNVRRTLDGIQTEVGRQRRVFRRTVVVCAALVVVTVALLVAFLIDARERRAAAESPLQLKIQTK